MAKAVSFGFLYGQSAKGFVVYAKTKYRLESGRWGCRTLQGKLVFHLSRYSPMAHRMQT